MAAVTITLDDLTPFAPGIDAQKAQAMIDDTLARAARVAPCILSDTFEHDAAARAILRGAILRWNDSGTGALASQTAGPFGQTLDTRQQRKSMFWPSEIEELQELCRTSTEQSGAFTIDTVPTSGALIHNETCAINFGGAYCSCGAVLTQNLPLYGYGY